jgi:hypothetical protein
VALSNALAEIRGFDLKSEMGPEARPDWTKSNQPPPSNQPSGGDGGGARGGGGGGGDRLMTRNERIAQMRGERRARRDEELAAFHEDRGAFYSAVNAQDRAARKRDRAMQQGRMKDMVRDQYGARNMGEAYQKYREETPMKGRLTEDQFNRLYADMAKSPDQRAREEQEMRDKAKGGGGEKSGMEIAIEEIKRVIGKHLPNIDEKLPQHAVV